MSRMLELHPVGPIDRGELDRILKLMESKTAKHFTQMEVLLLQQTFALRMALSDANKREQDLLIEIASLREDRDV